MLDRYTPCKVLRSFKETNSLQDYARKVFPCKILQGKHFLARSFKETISLQDRARKKIPWKIFQEKRFLQGSCKILARNAFFSTRGGTEEKC